MLPQGVREADFAPVKNREGSGKDSPDTARALITALHRGWIEAAGGTVAGTRVGDWGEGTLTGGGDGGGDAVEIGAEIVSKVGNGPRLAPALVLVEVAPAVSFAGEGLEGIVGGMVVDHRSLVGGPTVGVGSLEAQKSTPKPMPQPKQRAEDTTYPETSRTNQTAATASKKRKPAASSARPASERPRTRSQSTR
jgi:hypothetical protein